MKTTAGMCHASKRPFANGRITGRFCANTIWRCHSGCCATFPGAFANPSGLDVAPDGLAGRRLPALRFFVALGVAIEGSLEISESNDKAGPAVDEAKLENVMLDERPCAMAESAGHRYALVCELRHAKRGIAVHLVDDLFQIAEGKLPDRVLQRAHRPPAKHFEPLVPRFKSVANAAFAKELRLTEIRIPARAPDPAAHHVAAPRHHVDFMRRGSGHQRQNFIADGLGTAFVGIEAENPVEVAGLYRPIAQIAKTLEGHVDDSCAKRTSNLNRTVGAE